MPDRTLYIPEPPRASYRINASISDNEFSCYHACEIWVNRLVLTPEIRSDETTGGRLSVSAAMLLLPDLY